MKAIQTMATQIGNPNAAMQGESSDSDGATADGSYIILISVDGQGRILVGVESDGGAAQSDMGGGASAAGSAAAPGANAGGQSSAGGATNANGGGGAAATPVAMTPARNIKDALTQALEIYKNNGLLSEGGGDADFNAGFGGDAGNSSGALSRGGAGAVAGAGAGGAQ